MFEEFYRHSGRLIYAGKEYKMIYFCNDKTIVDNSGITQSLMVVYAKPENSTDAPEHVGAGAEFVFADDSKVDAGTAKRIFDHFENQLECWKFEVVK